MKFKKISAILISSLLAITFFTGCNDESAKKEKPSIKKESASSKAFQDSSYIVDSKWIKDHALDSDLTILDARSDKSYSKEHLKNALNVSWQQFSNVSVKPSEKGFATLLDEKNLSKQIADLGITKDSKVLVYGDANKAWGEEGRIVWMLRAAGVKNSFFASESFDSIKSNDVKIDNVLNKAKKSSDFEISKLDLSTSIFTKELKESLNSDIKIIDTREKEEFEGAQKYGEARGGHIKGAINIPFTQLFNEDSSLKSADELSALFEKNNIKPNDKVVAYCTAGIRSGYMTNVLKMLGYENARNYQDSFYGWAGDKDAPVEK